MNAILHSVKPIIVVVDNLDIGGVQRLAMDESYYFHSEGRTCVLVSFTQTIKFKSILDVDEEFLKSSPLDIRVAPIGEKSRIRFFGDLVEKIRPEVILCHSARAIAYFRILRILRPSRNFKILGFVHQIPQMSDKLQTFKRAVYFRLADKVFAVSNQFGLEIGHLRQKSFFYRVLFRKDISFDRIGVNLKRLDHQSLHASVKIEGHRPLLYLGRITKWKGFDRFCQYVEEAFQGDDIIVFTSPALHADIFDDGFFKKHNRSIIFSKTIASFLWPSSAIHLYPTFYSDEVKFPMSISLNVLECIYLGIPSVISRENFESWPELKESILCSMTDWSTIELVEIISRLRKVNKENLIEESNKLRGVISIEGHCERVIAAQ